MKSKSLIAHAVSALIGLALPNHPGLPSLMGRYPAIKHKNPKKKPKKTRKDFEALAAAQAKRERKAAKRTQTL